MRMGYHVMYISAERLILLFKYSPSEHVVIIRENKVIGTYTFCTCASMLKGCGYNVMLFRGKGHKLCMVKWLVYFT